MDAGQAQFRQQIQTPSFALQPNTSRFATRDYPPRSTPIVTMNGSELPITSDAMSQSQPAGMWTTPVSHGMRPRPATIHEGFSFPVGEDFGALSPWDSSALPLQTGPHGVMSRPGSVHQQQDFYHATSTPMDQGWHQKPCPDTYDIEGLDPSLTIGQAFTTDEAIPVLDLRYANQPKDAEPLTFDNGPHPRRMSGSSFTMSTSGALSDMPSYDDFSAALSEAPSFSSDYPPLSNRNSLMSSTQLSPVASPRMTPQSRTELVRTQSRGRASPSPRPGVRSAPYSVERPQNKRWSTGTYGTTPQRRPSPFIYHPGHDAFGAHQRLPSRNGSPTIQHQHVPLSFNNLQAAQQHPFLMPGPPQYPQSNMFLPSQIPSQSFHPEPQRFEQPPPLMSHGLFRMLSSNADPHALHGHYADLSDPPDLYAALHEEQIPPPPEDMNPSDPDLVPHEQELRFEGDLYTPRWVRGHGNKREGWCGICKPGRWLVLKNSAFWYDKSFTHGISAATGSPFQEPHETRRMDGNPDVWEGLCGSCNEWIALVSSKKKGTTWFRHAYKCHTHPKIKDGPKRRRESSNTRALAASTMAKPKTEPQTQAQAQAQAQAPITPQMTPAALSTTSTPTPAQMSQHGHHHHPPPPMPHLGQDHMRNMMSSPLGGMPNMI